MPEEDKGAGPRQAACVCPRPGPRGVARLQQGEGRIGIARVREDQGRTPAAARRELQALQGRRARRQQAAQRGLGRAGRHAVHQQLAQIVPRDLPRRGRLGACRRRVHAWKGTFCHATGSKRTPWSSTWREGAGVRLAACTD